MLILAFDGWSAEIEFLRSRMRSMFLTASRTRHSTWGRNIPGPLQDLMRQHGYPVPDRGNDLIFHWAKHVLGDQQWTSDTTPEEYWQYGQAAIRHEESQLVVLNAASGHDVAIVIAKTANVVPERRLGPRAGDEVLVIYSATTGRILSVHMVESSFRLTAGTSTVWLPR